jgi:hypothetical protein
MRFRARKTFRFGPFYPSPAAGRSGSSSARSRTTSPGARRPSTPPARVASTTSTAVVASADPTQVTQFPPPAPKSTLARRLTIFVGIAAFLFGIGVGWVPRRSPTPAVSPS